MEPIYQLKIELKDLNPKIWRRIQVKGDTSFSELHDIIQLSMGWEGQHLYEFTINGVRIYDFLDAIDDGTNPSERDSMDTFLDEFLKMAKSRFTYIYDFGDHWEHEILVEKIFPEEKDYTYPICLDGERAVPPEDCGGIWGYQEILEILSNKNHPQYEETIEWLGEEWDPEFFDCNQTNVLLQDYGEQWEEIYKETEEIMEDLENNGDYIDYEEGFETEFEELKKFSNPKDVFRNDFEREGMEEWIQRELKEKNSLERQAFERLRNLGFDENKIIDLMLKALSIEWFYELKYETDHLEDRYEYNLRQLPEIPREIPRLKDALDVLNRCKKGVPFSAIEYLQNDSSNEATTEILNALKNYSDHQYCWEDCVLSPFWYALAAEGHICEELIDPVIRLYEENINESDWLNEQGQYLIGKLAEKYPDLTAQRILEAMKKSAEEKSNSIIFYLFDAFYFCDIEKYKSQLLALLERNDFVWHDALAHTIAVLQIKEALPILKKQLKALKAKPKSPSNKWNSTIEIEEAIQILEGEIILAPKEIMPLSLTRKKSWQEDLKEHENLFYDEESSYTGFDFPESEEKDLNVKWPHLTPVMPLIKEKTPGRNDPCHCGSGKKYKKCCMDKDSQIS